MASTTAPNEQTRQVGEGATWFLLQVLTGILVIVLLGLHMVAHHFVVEGGLRNFQQVVDYVSNPIVFLTSLLFLITVTPHALLGVRAIIFDLGLSPETERIINRVLLVVGIVTIIYGVWLAIAIQQL